MRSHQRPSSTPHPQEDHERHAVGTARPVSYPVSHQSPRLPDWRARSPRLTPSPFQMAYRFPLPESYFQDHADPGAPQTDDASRRGNPEMKLDAKIEELAEAMRTSGMYSHQDIGNLQEFMARPRSVSQNQMVRDTSETAFPRNLSYASRPFVPSADVNNTMRPDPLFWFYDNGILPRERRQTLNSSVGDFMEGVSYSTPAIGNNNNYQTSMTQSSSLPTPDSPDRTKRMGQIFNMPPFVPSTGGNPPLGPDDENGKRLSVYRTVPGLPEPFYPGSLNYVGPFLDDATQDNPPLGPDDENGKRLSVHRTVPGLPEPFYPGSLNYVGPFLDDATPDNLLSKSNPTTAPAFQPPTGPRALTSFQPTEQRLSQRAASEFRPMQAVLDPTVREHQRHEDSKPTAMMSEDAEAKAKFSVRYYGMHTEGNASADHIPNALNCALWLRNLPPDVTYPELLDAIKGLGRVYCTYINKPDFVSHTTAAAKVVFFQPISARNFINHIETSPIFIRGHRIKADYNRIKYAEHTLPGNPTRVLIITGQSWFVNEENLISFFSDKFIFQVDRVIELVNLGGRSVVEFRFGSYRSQSQMGKMSLDKNQPAGLEKVEFGEDPTEMGDSFVSYRTAIDRIQGRGIPTLRDGTTGV